MTKKLQREFATRNTAAELRVIARSLSDQGNRGQSVLIKALRSKRPAERNAAIGGLSALTDNSAVVDALIKAFRGGSSESKTQIFRALRNLKNKTRLARICLEAAQDGDNRVRSGAFRRMHDCPGGKVLAALKQAFAETEDSSLLHAVAHGLSGQGKAGVAVLVQALGSKTAAVRRAAVVALGSAEKNPETLRALITAFEAAPDDAQEGILQGG